MNHSHGKTPDHAARPEGKGKGERIRKEKAKEASGREGRNIPWAPELYSSFGTIRGFDEENPRHKSHRA
jgi:hypothetical protein